MSRNRSKSGDFNLDQELMSKIAANEAGQPLADEHEDQKELEMEFNEQFSLVENKYGIHPQLKRREELINSDVLLSVRNLKQFFFFGSGLNKTKLKGLFLQSFFCLIELFKVAFIFYI